jgi:predicted dehydrogenase
MPAGCGLRPGLRVAQTLFGREAVSQSSELIKSGEVDAVLIATPHYSRAPIGIQALEAGLHVLVEKPLCVHKADCERLISVPLSPGQVFAVMFNQRTDPCYIRLRELIRGGELGEIRRINWIITNWFRTAAYYASGGWRATWAGEGGGVLLNQSPHQLDLWQWLFGMPRKVRAFCEIGRYHDIEVEDDVTAYFEYENGTTGVFVTSTGEAPGTDRLELAAENGRVVIENGRFVFAKTEVPMSEFGKTSPERLANPEPMTWRFSFATTGTARGNASGLCG